MILRKFQSLKLGKISLIPILSLFILSIFSYGCYHTQEGTPAYSLASKCYSVRGSSNLNQIAIDGMDSYRMVSTFSPEIISARFYIKATGLGTFLLYDQEGGFLATEGIKVKRQWTADANAEWKILTLEVSTNGAKVSDSFTFISSKTGLKLSPTATIPGIVDNGENAPELIAFDIIPNPIDSCKSYPEASLDASVSLDFNKPILDNSPVKGFADFHTHLAFPKALGAAAMSGNLFHRFGIEHALHDCESLHGKNGSLDFLEGQTNSDSGSGHITVGYPTFTYWPNRNTNTHVMAYYKWIQRSFYSGLRLLVTNTTGNPTYCQLLKILHPLDSEGDCRSDADTSMQVQYIYDLQDYIDAQEGGPGKGWFRIAKSSAEARQIIKSNKLAVVLGSEYGTLFDCAESNAGCDENYIDRKLTELHNLGVRSVFPIHRFDNAFGGTMPAGGTNGSWMNLTSKVSTSKIQTLTDLIDPSKLLFQPVGGHYWELEKCPDGVEGTTGVKSMKKFFDEDFSFLTQKVSSIPVVGALAAQVLGFVFLDKLKPYPEYADFQNGESACNIRPLQNAGRFLINRLMDKGMILEVDHLGYKTFMEMLSILEARQYPGFVSSHGWIENTPAIRNRMFQLGGLMASSNGNAKSVSSRIQLYSSEMASFSNFIGVGIGTDIQGISAQAGPDAGVVIQYPFASFDGKVIFTQPKTGNRAFDYAKEGVAHYGMLPEWVESLRQLDQKNGTKSLDTFMNSAEAYLQMWEKSEKMMK